MLYRAVPSSMPPTTTPRQSRSATRLSPTGAHAAPGCGAKLPAILILPMAKPRASGSICFSPRRSGRADAGVHLIWHIPCHSSNDWQISEHASYNTRAMRIAATSSSASKSPKRGNSSPSGGHASGREGGLERYWGPSGSPLPLLLRKLVAR